MLKQGVGLADVYRTLQCYMGGIFVNYFNRFGRQWQVYVEAEGQYRSKPEDLNSYYVRNRDGQMVPLSALTTVEHRLGPEFTMRYNLYRSAQINGSAAPGYSSDQARAALEDVFAQTMPREMGYDYLGMSFQEKKAERGRPPAAIFALSLVFVFLILAALYESWSLPFSVLLGVPVAVFGAFAALLAAGDREQRLRPDRARHADRPVGQERDPDRRIRRARASSTGPARRGRPRGRPDPAAADPDDVVRLHPGLRAARLRLGAGAVARQVMGTAVIGGMLAASVLAIFLIPVTFHRRRKALRGRAQARPPAGRRPRGALRRRRGAPARGALNRHESPPPRPGPRPRPRRLRRRPELPRPETAAPAAFRGEPAAGSASLADLGWWDLYRDPVLTRLIGEALRNGADARIAAARVEEARGLSVEAGGQSGRRRLRRRRVPRQKRHPGQRQSVRHRGDGRELRGLPVGRLGDRPLGQDPPAERGGPRPIPRHRGGPTGRRAEPCRRGRLGLLPAPRARPGAGDFPGGRRLLRPEPEALRRKAAGRDRLQARDLERPRGPGRGRRPRSPRSSAKSPSRKTSSASFSAGIPGPIERGSGLDERALGSRGPGRACPLPSSSAGPTSAPAEYAAETANAQIGLAVGNFLPADRAHRHPRRHEPAAPGHHRPPPALWAAGAQVSGPIFQGGRCAGRYLEARGEWEEAKVRYQQAALNAFADAASALTVRQRLAEVRAAQQTEVDAYKEAVGVAVDRYKAGQASYYELLQVQQQLYPAESALAQTRRDELISVVQLYQALGGGWNLSDPKAWQGPT